MAHCQDADQYKVKLPPCGACNTVVNSFLNNAKKEDNFQKILERTNGLHFHSFIMNFCRLLIVRENIVMGIGHDYSISTLTNTFIADIKDNMNSSDL